MRTIVIILTILFFSIVNTISSIATEKPKGPGKISGSVTDAETGTPMEYANIRLFSKVDSSLVTGTITSPEGSFMLEKLNNGKYFMKVSFIGFDEMVIDDINLSRTNRNIQLGSLKLSPTANELDAISVKAEKSRVEYQIDKRVINVTKDVIAAGGSAVQVLENTPSVQVDAEGNVSLRGSSDFTVLINGKPTILSGSDALKQLPAATIEKIEVITNPSAKYEADGTSGIINVIVKKNKLQGFNGMLSGSAGTGDKYTGNANFNYKKGKVNVFAGGDFTDNTYSNSIDFNGVQTFNSATYNINYDGKMKFFQEARILRGGFDYYINDKNSLSFSGSFGERGYDRSTNSNYEYINEENISDYSRSDKFQDVYGKVSEINTDYAHDFSENHNLKTTFHYESWDGYNNDGVKEFETDKNWNDIATKSRFKYEQDEYNYLYRINTDYTRPLGKGKIETGYQFRFHDRKDDLLFKDMDVTTNQWNINEEYTNDMHYKRYIQSAYATYSGSKKGVNYQVGLRAEYTDRDIYMSVEDKSHTYKNMALFPSVHLSKELKAKQQLQISYSRRTRRPVAWLLNGTPSFIDPNNIFRGNPDVKPEYINSYEINYRKSFEKTSISAQAYYRQTLNGFTQTHIMDENGVTTHYFANSGQEKAMGLELGANFNLVKWWQLNLNTNLYNYEIEGEIGETSKTQQNFTWDANMSSTFVLKYNTRIQLNGYYSAKSVSLQGEGDDFITFSLAVNKSFLDGRATLGIVARDLFNTMNFNYKTRDYNYYTDLHINPEQVFMINFSYRFNNYKHKQRGSRDQTEFGGSNGF